MVINGFFTQDGTAVRVKDIESIKVTGNCITFVDSGELSVDMDGYSYSHNNEYKNIKIIKKHQDLNVEFEYTVEIFSKNKDVYYSLTNISTIHYDEINEYTHECQKIMSDEIDKIMIELLTSFNDNKSYNIKENDGSV